MLVSRCPLLIARNHILPLRLVGTLISPDAYLSGVNSGVACLQCTVEEILKVESINDTFALYRRHCGCTKADHDGNPDRFLKVAIKYGFTIKTDKTVIFVDKIQFLDYLISQGEVTPDMERMKPLRKTPPPKNMKSLRRATGMFSKWIPPFSGKTNPPVGNKTFPLPQHVRHAFDNLKKALGCDMIVTVNRSDPLMVEIDPSVIATTASLSETNRSVPFFSRTVTASKKRHPAAEKKSARLSKLIKSGDTTS